VRTNHENNFNGVVKKNSLSIFVYFRKRKDTARYASYGSDSPKTRAPDGVGEGGNNQLERSVGVNGEEQ
jgi:hypothetical protein